MTCCSLETSKPSSGGFVITFLLYYAIIFYGTTFYKKYLAVIRYKISNIRYKKHLAVSPRAEGAYL